MTSSRIFIEQLIAEGEHQQLDFKFRIDESAKIAKTLVAFANTDGGRLLIGVKDNGKISGVKSDEDFYVVEAAAELYASPAIGFEMRTWDVSGKKVIEIYVPPSSQKPHRTKDEEGNFKAYYRSEDKNIAANGVMLKVWALGLGKQPPSWEYSEPEQMLLAYLRERGRISLSAFCRISRLRRHKAEQTLARLVSWQIVKMVRAEGGFRFELAEEEG